MFKFQKRSLQMCENNFLEFLTYLDFFGSPPLFKILKKKKYSTSFGVICTLLIILLCSFYFIQQLQDLYMSRNPFVLMIEKQEIDMPVVPLHIQNFTLAVTMADINQNSLNTLNQHFTITIQNCHRQRFLNETTKKMDIQFCNTYPTEPCNDKHFISETQKTYFSRIKLGNVQCIEEKIWRENPPVLQGTIQSMNYSYLTVQVSACQNSTNSQTCASKESIEKGLNNGYYAAHMSDNILQHDLAGNPYQETITLQYTSFSYKNSKILTSYLKMIETVTDKGRIFKELFGQSALVQSTIQQNTELSNNEFLILHNLFIHYKQLEYKRSYIKIQSILGMTGGLWQILILISFLIVKPINLKFMNLEMGNKLFRFENAKDAEEIYRIRAHSSTSHQHGVNLSSQTPQAKVRFHNKLQNLGGIKSKQDLKTILKQRKKSINVKFKDLMSFLFGCDKRIKKQIGYTTEKIMQKLDVAYIIQKIQEIDKLKFILLNEEQLNLFQYISKPLIPSAIFDQDFSSKIKVLEDHKAYKFILHEEMSETMKTEIAFKAYLKLIDKQDRSFIDNQILDILDEEICQVFEYLRDGNKADVIFQSNIESPKCLLQDEVKELNPQIDQIEY